MQSAASWLLIASMALLPAAAFAQSRDLFAGLSPGDGICFGRTYDRAHLAKHPHQQVTSMDMSFGVSPKTEFGDSFNIFQMDVTLRDGTSGTARGECRSEGDAMFCGVDCDGGGVFIKLRNADQMLVDLERKGTIAMSYSCGEEEGFPLQSGRDDKTFLLTRMPPQFCMPPEW